MKIGLTVNFLFMEDQIMPAKGGIFLYADSQCLLWNSNFSENADLSTCKENF